MSAQHVLISQGQYKDLVQKAFADPAVPEEFARQGYSFDGNPPDTRFASEVTQQLADRGVRLPTGLPPIEFPLTQDLLPIANHLGTDCPAPRLVRQGKR